MDIYVKTFFDFHIFFLFSVFNYDFVIHINFTHVAASKAAINDVTN